MADHRGPAIIALGEAVAGADGLLTPRILGAARPGADPGAMKKLWHYVARYGRQ